MFTNRPNWLVLTDILFRTSPLEDAISSNLGGIGTRVVKRRKNMQPPRSSVIEHENCTIIVRVTQYTALKGN